MRARNAFTLIELIITLALLAIMAVVGFVAIGSYQTQHLYAAAERVASDLRYAKSLALSSTLWHGVDFQKDPTNTYNVYQTDGMTDTNISDPVDPGKDYIVNLYDEYDGVVIQAVNIGGGDKVEFDAYGEPHTDKPGVPVTPAGLIVLSKGGVNVNIRIGSETGRIYIE